MNETHQKLLKNFQHYDRTPDHDFDNHDEHAESIDDGNVKDILDDEPK